MERKIALEKLIVIGVKDDFFHSPGGAKEPWRTECTCDWHQSGGKHPELSPTYPVCSWGAGSAGPSLHPVFGPGGSEQVQGDGQVRNLMTSVAWVVSQRWISPSTGATHHLFPIAFLFSVFFKVYSQWILSFRQCFILIFTVMQLLSFFTGMRMSKTTVSPFLKIFQHFLCEQN